MERKNDVSANKVKIGEAKVIFGCFEDLQQAFITNYRNRSR